MRISRSFDRPGALGLATFVLPLVLDGIFHKACPAIFGPNTIAMLQRDGISFRGVAWRKRRDRLNQAIALGAAATAAAVVTRTLARAVVRLVGGVVGAMGPMPAALGACAATGGGVLALRARGLLNTDMAPADVLARVLDKRSLTDPIEAEDAGVRVEAAS